MKYFFSISQGLIVSIFLVFSLPAMAVQIEFHTFENEQREKLYLDLIAELRCVKCQNQNLAESNAELATDMREKTYEMVSAGKSREDVVNYMTARYGDFVLYKPPFKSKTLLLWIGPPLMLLFSLYLLLRVIRKQSTQNSKQLSDTERESVRNVLNSNSSSEK
ncbi:MAG: cytochrome c-type biogenesis protein CcmH [Cocleimonas sp.]|jgi:cytochrome c-type biogenesis protein CcmH